jgi:putative photosynthetic complex assembly protein
MSGPIHFEPEPGARPGAPATMNVPKPALIMAGALVVVVFALAISARVFGFGAFHEATSAVLAERQLTFTDAKDGGIFVEDAQTHAVAAHLPPGSNGFIRGALRALTRERALAGIGRELPFRLVRYTDGRLVLLDPATTQHITITSFGPTQIEAFDQLLIVGPTPAQVPTR